jgi:hypothetical protein
MQPARRACNWEQGEWVWPHVRKGTELNLVAAVRVRSGNTRQATNRRRKDRGQVTGNGSAEIDDDAAAGQRRPG